MKAKRIFKSVLSCSVVVATLLNCIVITYAARIETRCPNADGESYLIGLNDHGWTAFNIYYVNSETYNTQTENANYTSREAYVTVSSSRPSWDNPYSLSVTPISHYNSGGTKLRTFTMTTGSYILPSNLWAWSCKVNNDSVRYIRYGNYKSRFSIGIFATGCLNPYSKIVELSLNV